MENLIRAATLSPETLDAERGTIDATISTFAPVQRRGYVERLDPAGLDQSGLVGAPVLDGHRQGSARDVIGVVEAVRMEGDALVATVRLSSAPDVSSTVQKIKEGTVRGVSIGYAVTRWAESVIPKPASASGRRPCGASAKFPPSPSPPTRPPPSGDKPWNKKPSKPKPAPR
jgi:hypothetical protein